jgi:hypothetical protein
VREKCCQKTTTRLTTVPIYVRLLIDGGIHNNMSGIYILETVDGYRVSYSRRYEDLIGINAEINYYVAGNVAKEVFENCFCYDTIEDALEHARRISGVYPETDDGICVVKYAKNLTFGELIENGKNTGR